MVRCFPQEPPLRSAAATATSYALWFVFLLSRGDGDSGEGSVMYAMCAFAWLFSLPLCLLGADMAEKAIQRQKVS